MPRVWWDGHFTICGVVPEIQRAVASCFRVQYLNQSIFYFRSWPSWSINVGKNWVITSDPFIGSDGQCRKKKWELKSWHLDYGQTP